MSGHSRVQGSWGTLTERSRTAKEEVPRRSREKVTKKEHGPGVDAAGGIWETGSCEELGEPSLP